VINDPVGAVLFYLNHALPLILIIFDWWHNSIRVSFQRSTILISSFASIGGILGLVCSQLSTISPFYSLDLSSDRATSAIVLSGLFMGFAGSLYLVSLMTEIRLGARVPADSTTGDLTSTDDGSNTSGNGGDSTNTGGNTGGNSTGGGGSTTGGGTTGGGTNGGTTGGGTSGGGSDTSGGNTGGGTSTGGGGSTTDPTVPKDPAVPAKLFQKTKFNVVYL